MPASCCVESCATIHGRDNIKLYKFPRIQNKNDYLNDLSKRRQQAWLKAINRKDLNANNIQYLHVCAKHFISGKSANIKDELNPDWVPSLHLGYGTKQKKKPLARYARAIKRNKIKNDLLKLKPHSPPSAPILTVEETPEPMEQTPEPMEETPTPKTREMCTQTEDFYIIEGANEALEKKCKEQAERIKCLQKEIIELKEKVHNKTTLDDLENNAKQVKYFTGFDHFKTMKIIYNKVKEDMPIVKSGKMNKFDVFFVTFMKMRLDLPFTYISYQYGVTVKTLSKLFNKAIKILSNMLSCCFIFLPDKNASITNNVCEMFWKKSGVHY